MLDRHEPKRIFTLGGDCGVELAPISWLNNKIPNEFAVVWFDAHADINTPESFPSKTFHGTVLRNLLGGVDIDGHSTFQPLKPEQIVLAGVRDLDAPEKEYIEEKGITIDHCDNLTASGGSTLAHILVQRGYRRCYIHIDPDVLSLDEFDSTTTPSEGGIRLEVLGQAISELRAKLEIVGGSLCEVTRDIEKHQGPREALGKVFNSLFDYSYAKPTQEV